MKYSSKKGLDISAFSLGTVQLGMDYGLGEHTAKPEKEYAFSLLDRAIEKGVNMLDTANNYGDSERVIGEGLKTVEGEKKPMIVTKIGPFDHSSPEALEKDIYAQTEACMKTLGVEQIDILMAHDYDDYEKNPEILKRVFNELKVSGKIRYSAISVYSCHDYSFVAESGFDAVQIPLNIFDWSQIEKGGIKALESAGMMIFTRSVFLQGLVFLKPEEIDPKMNFCVPYVERFLELCGEFKLSPSVLAMSFVLSVPGVTSLVLGCQTLEQLDSNCEMINAVRKLTVDEMNKIREAFIDIDHRVIDPRCWYNHF